MNKFTTFNFVEKSKEIHNNKYDYSLVEYNGIHNKVKIICLIHGVFEQTPNSHLKNRGCPKCGGSKKLTTEEFIQKSKEIHGNKYDYSLVDYKNCNKRVNIICPIHGIFKQIPSSHLNGNGCSKCFFDINSINKTYTLNKIIDDSKEIHGDKYDYSLVKYNGIDKKIRIICPIHGEFEQTPTKHINGQGCPKCAGKNKTTEEFIQQCKNIHGDKYNYSLTNYINNTQKVKIICKKHGIFEQTPANHTHIKLQQGCPYCYDSKGESKIKNILNKNNIKYETQKTFEGCVYKRKLKFDFYLLEYNVCLEYDGEQHTTMYRFEKNDEKLQIRILRDNIKTGFCLKNNIKLIRINYNENIEEKLLLITK